MIEGESHSIKLEAVRLVNERQSLTELRMICALVEEWGNITLEPPDLILIFQNHSQNIRTMV